jgi:hypothetical protein
VRVINRQGYEHCRVLLGRVYSDFWGPYYVPGLSGELYILTFTNEYNRKTWVFFIKSRRVLRSVFQLYRARVEVEIGLKIRAIHCDNAPEYVKLGKDLATTGIAFEYITPYTLE